MIKTRHNLGLLTSLLAIALLSGVSGCSQSKVKTQLRSKVFKGSPTMKTILQNRHRSSAPVQQDYHRAPDWSARASRQGYRTAVFNPAGDTNYNAYTRTERNELNGIFPRLPNPDLCMYVFPHLTSEQATVPGYSSCFAMYDTNQYALPGEMSAIWQSRGSIQ